MTRYCFLRKLDVKIQDNAGDAESAQDSRLSLASRRAADHLRSLEGSVLVHAVGRRALVSPLTCAAANSHLALAYDRVEMKAKDSSMRGAMKDWMRFVEMQEMKRKTITRIVQRGQVNVTSSSSTCDDVIPNIRNDGN